METEINVEKIVQYWITTSDNDYDTMQSLLESKRYSWALFLGHLVLEKLLKAYYVKHKQTDAPLIHDLVRIAERSGITISAEQKSMLNTITEFNINARYDNYKLLFYQRCTAEYTATWSQNIKQLRLWFKQQL